MIKQIVLYFLCLFFAVAGNVEKIKTEIKKGYETFYKNNAIHINTIDLELSHSTQIDEVKIKSIVLENNEFKTHGVVQIVFLYKNKEYRHLIKYRVDANLKVAYSKNGIKKSQDITKDNTIIKTINLSEISSMPMGLKEIDSVGAKIFIPNNTMIVQHHIESKVLIRKNESFLAVYKEGNMQIQLVLIAKEDGVKNAIIEAINPETKKVLRVRVLSNATGEIL